MQNQYLSEFFKQPPLTAFRRQRNLRDILIKSKVPSPRPLHPKRPIKGMAPCNKPYPACPYVERGKEVKIDEERAWKINRKINCDTFNCIYMIQCKKNRSEERYIGRTKRIIKFRIAEHWANVTNQVLNRATGSHFNLPGHSLADLKFTILEQVKYQDEDYRREREFYFINKFNTFYQGINREGWRGIK